MTNQDLINNLLKGNPDFNVTLKAIELMELVENTADRTVKKYIEKHDEKVFSRKEVVQKFGICEASLWRWGKMGLIESKKIGNRVFFPESEIKRLMSRKGGEK